MRRLRRTLALAALLVLAGAGPAAAAPTVEYGVALAPRDPAALDAFVAAVSTPGSPQFGQYLRGAEFGERFGPAPETVAAVSDALRGAGLEPGSLPANSIILPVRGTAAQVQAALGPQLAEPGVATRTAGSPLPASVTDEVLGVLELGPVAADGASALRAQGPAEPTTRSAPSRLASPPAACPAAATAAAGYSPAPWLFDQIATAYDVSTVRNAGGWGDGVTVALMEWGSFNWTDLVAFQQCYGTSANVVDVMMNGGPAGNATHAEPTIDIQTVVGLAPQATVFVYQSPGGWNASIAQKLSMFSLVATNNSADIVVDNWGTCEADANGVELVEATLLAQMAAQGQSAMGHSGNWGSVDCGGSLSVDDPGSQPDMLSVGGTTMSAIGSPLATPPTEVTWNNGAANGGGASGGGISERHVMPTWQAGPGVISASSSGTPCSAPPGKLCRQVPDVSALADWNQGYLYYYTGGGENGWYKDGGSNAAASLWAGLTASILSAPQCHGQRLGLLGPRLYALAAAGAPAFNDITSGNNDLAGTDPTHYAAGPGYDMATGLGTPVGGGLLAGLCLLPASSAGGGGGGGGRAASAERDPDGTTTPAPTPTAAPAPGAPVPTGAPAAPAPRAEVLDKTPTVSRDGRFALGVGCPAGSADCRVDVRVKGKGVDLRMHNRRVEAGDRRELPMRLPRKLRGRDRVTLTVTVTTRTAAGQTTTSTQKIVVRRARGA